MVVALSACHGPIAAAGPGTVAVLFGTDQKMRAKRAKIKLSSLVNRRPCRRFTDSRPV